MNIHRSRFNLIVLYPASHMIVEDNHQIKDYHIIVVISQCSAWLDYSLPSREVVNVAASTIFFNSVLYREEHHGYVKNSFGVVLENKPLFIRT